MKHLFYVHGVKFDIMTHQVSADRTNYWLYVRGTKIGDVRTSMPTEQEAYQDYQVHERARQHRLKTSGPKNSREWAEVLKKPGKYPHLVMRMTNRTKK